MKVDGVEHRSQTENHVRPTLASRRAVVKFAQPASMRRFLRKTLTDAKRGQPVENAELALTEPFVDDGARWSVGERSGLADRLGGLSCAHIRRGEDDFGTFSSRQRCEIAAGRFRLPEPEIGE